jgi:hypothetical protein
MSKDVMIPEVAKPLIPIPQVAKFKAAMYKKLKEISNTVTPEVDGSGKKIIGKRDGYDYIIEAYMRDQLDKSFPGWSWEGLPVVPMGSE